MENNIIFICPSWEDRSLLGFEQDYNDVKISKVIAIRKGHPINELEISDCIDKITNICTQQAITYEEIIWKDNPSKNSEQLSSCLNKLNTNDIVHIDITTMPRDIIWTLLFLSKDTDIRLLIWQ